MKLNLLASTLVALICVKAHSFSTPRKGASTTSKRSSNSLGNSIPSHVSSIARGGAMETSGGSSSSALSSLPMGVSLETAIAAVSSRLVSGPYGVLALSAITWSVVLPLTLYKKIYGIGVAYGFSVGAAGLVLLKLFPEASTGPAPLLAKACLFYGVRLGYYLLLRDYSRDKPSSVPNGSIVSRVTFSCSLALYYALLTTPLLYALRSAEALASSQVAMAGAGLAWFGAILEAIADFQKLGVKQSNKDKEGTFVGPTSLVYRLSRHPNYLGEVLFWTGLFVGGAPSFGSNPIAWICSGLGWFGSVSIMRQATAGLEKRQAEKYGGQDAYETWKKQVTGSLLPFV